MKKKFLFLTLFLGTISFIFADMTQNFTRLALRDISGGSDSDSTDSFVADDTPYKSTKRLRGWSSSLILGLYIPVSDLTLKDSDGFKNPDVEHSAVAFQIGGVSMNLENGFTIKYDYNIGGGSGENLNYYDGKSVDQGGFDMSLNVALGWAPVRKEHFRLAVLGAIGIQFDYLTGDGKWSDGTNIYSATYKDVLFDFNLGFDIYAAIHCNRHFGLYFDLGYKGIVSGSDGYTLKVGSNNFNSDYDLSGSRWIPQFGCLITF